MNEAMKRKPRARRLFMRPETLHRLRTDVLRVSQGDLCKVIDSPDTGEPISIATFSRWERGKLIIPLWAARRVRKLVEVSRSIDDEEKGNR